MPISRMCSATPKCQPLRGRCEHFGVAEHIRDIGIKEQRALEPFGSQARQAMVHMIAYGQRRNKNVIRFQLNRQGCRDVNKQILVGGMERDKDFVRIHGIPFRSATVNAIGQAETGDFGSNNGDGCQVLVAACLHQFVYIRDAPTGMAAQRERRKRAGGRVPGKNCPDLNPDSLAGLLKDQPAAGKNGIVEVRGKIDPAHRIGRMPSAPTPLQ